MSSVSHPQDERLAELLADQAIGALTPAEELELEAILAADGVDSDLSMAATAASLELALMRPGELRPMPARVQRRLQRAGKKWAKATASVLQTTDFLDNPVPEATRRTRRLIFTAGPWLAAAACLVLALVSWWPNVNNDFITAVNRDPNRVVMNWVEWNNPEVRGVQGEAVWCDHSQKGYLRFANLPPNDPSKEQYQLWIIDDRGMEQRISGGVFDVPDSGEAIVPIKPGIPVRNARAFAVTIEKPGGIWVSDMSRRVAITSKK